MLDTICFNIVNIMTNIMTNMMTNIMTNIMTNMMTSMMTSMMTNMMTNTISYDDRNEIESLFSFMSLMSSLDALSRRFSAPQT